MYTCCEKTYLSMMYGAAKIFFVFNGPLVGDGKRDKTPGALFAIKKINRFAALIRVSRKFFFAKHLFACNLNKDIVEECTKISELVLSKSVPLLNRMIECSVDLAGSGNLDTLVRKSRLHDRYRDDTFAKMCGVKFSDFCTDFEKLGLALGDLESKYDFLTNLEVDGEWIKAAEQMTS